MEHSRRRRDTATYIYNATWRKRGSAADFVALAAFWLVAGAAVNVAVWLAYRLLVW